MEAVEYTHPGTPGKDDPQVEQAMTVWDNLNPGEQRELFRTLYRTVAAHKATSDIDHLVRFAESVDGMVRLESTTNLRQILRDTATAPGKSQGGTDFNGMARRLEG